MTLLSSGSGSWRRSDPDSVFLYGSNTGLALVWALRFKIPGSLFSVPILQNNGIKMASFLSNHKSCPYITFYPNSSKICCLLLVNFSWLKLRQRWNILWIYINKRCMKKFFFEFGSSFFLFGRVVIRTIWTNRTPI